MSKKESNPIPEGTVKPPPPPAPPPKRIIKEDIDREWFMGRSRVVKSCKAWPHCDMWYLICDKCGYGNRKENLNV
jgi:hypothetical protein